MCRHRPICTRLAAADEGIGTCTAAASVSVNWRQNTVRCRSIVLLSTCNPVLPLQVMWLASPRSEVQVHVCLPVSRAPWWVLLQHSITLWSFFIVECGSTHFLCAMCVFEVPVSSSLPGYHYAKFCFFHGLHCWTSPWRKPVYSITHSPSVMYKAPQHTQTLHVAASVHKSSEENLHKFWTV